MCTCQARRLVRPCQARRLVQPPHTSSPACFRVLLGFWGDIPPVWESMSQAVWYGSSFKKFSMSLLSYVSYIVKCSNIICHSCHIHIIMVPALQMYIFSSADSLCGGSAEKLLVCCRPTNELFWSSRAGDGRFLRVRSYFRSRGHDIFTFPLQRVAVWSKSNE